MRRLGKEILLGVSGTIVIVVPIERSNLVRQVVHVGALSMSRAQVGADGTLAALAFVAREALAVSALSVADAFARALLVVVVLSILVRGVYPGDLEGADAVRAVAGVVAEAQAPVVVAVAHAV